MKRFFDLTVSVLILVIGIAPLIFLFLMVRVFLGKPAIFRQQRPGKDGKLFLMYKFRTMTDARDSNGQLLSDAERTTKFGRLLRASSLDELPEIWNVIRGEMSLVGPRPLLVDYLPLYSPTEMRRHEVKPGITGWAQVNGRNAISWEQKFQLDVWYVDNHTLWLDLRILFLTALKVFRRENINTASGKTMEFFRGSKE